MLMSKSIDLVIAAAPNINSNGIVAWGVRNIIPIVLLVIGIGIIAGARKGQMSQNAMTITNVLLGCTVIAGAALFFGFADGIASFVFAKG
jgi:predicted branched-subunit amino acid permease